MPAKSAKQIGWIAGILEGEGTFSCLDNGTAPLIKIAMVDRDVIDRVAEILDYNGTISEDITSSYKPIFTIQLYGNSAIQWMMTIYCLMGQRRKEKIRSILTLWKYYERQYRTICKRGHLVQGDNVLIDANGYTVCRECRKINQKKADAKRRGKFQIIQKEA